MLTFAIGVVGIGEPDNLSFFQDICIVHIPPLILVSLIP